MARRCRRDRPLMIFARTSALAKRSHLRVLVAVFLFVFCAGQSQAQFKEAPQDKGARLDREATTRIKIGVVVKATGTTHHAIATAPIPIEWPEQRVQIVNEEVSPQVKNVSYRQVGAGGVKQMVVEIPQLLAGQEAKALITFEVTRNALAAPPDTSIFKIPKKLDRQLTVFIGTSPYIESRHPKIIAAAKEALSGHEEDTDWQKVEAIYDWTRTNIVQKSSELKGAARTLYEKEGDVDELPSVFIALCRSQKIPTRTVFVHGHCYAEFYLEDDDGQGHWFPCQVSGVRSFGSIAETRPILQKGDNFKNPENPKERQRLVTEYFTAMGRGGKPQVTFVSELVQ